LRGLCERRSVVPRGHRGDAGSRSAKLVRDWLARLRGWRLLLRDGRSRGLRSRGRWRGRFRRRCRRRLGRRGLGGEVLGFVGALPVYERERGPPLRFLVGSVKLRRNDKINSYRKRRAAGLRPFLLEDEFALERRDFLRDVG
jgi:hypothetical protein